MVGMTRSEKLEPWYAGAMSRAEAEDVLTDTPNGTFLIRDSDTRPGQYDLAISASMIPVPPTFWEARLPLFLGGRLPEPLTPPEVKHIKVLISYGKKKSKPLYAFAPNERRKWWSMQQLVDFFTTDSLERHFVGMSANLSTPYKHASPVRPKPLPSTSPYAEEDNTRTSVMFWALAVCVVAVAWVLVRTGWDGGTWEQCSPWVLAVTELPLVKAYGLYVSVAVAGSIVFYKIRYRHEASERAMARFKEEQALARYDTLTWDDMARGAGAIPPENSEGSGAEGKDDDEAAAAAAYDKPQHVKERTRGTATGRRAGAKKSK